MSAGLLTVSAATAELIWSISLGVFIVVLLVVALLLHSILRAAARIHDGVADIWTVGKQIAGNTVQIAALGGINRTAGRIVAAAGDIDAALQGIAEHARTCSGCPRCMLSSPAQPAPPGPGPQEIS